MKHIPPAIHMLCRRRASKRWSALLTQTRSRIGHLFGMRLHSFAIRNRVMHCLLGFITGWITSQSDDCALWERPAGKKASIKRHF